MQQQDKLFEGFSLFLVLLFVVVVASSSVVLSSLTSGESFVGWD